MTPATAQVLLTLIFIVGAIVFVLLGQDSLAVGLVGAIAGQGVSVGVQSVTTNGKGQA